MAAKATMGDRWTAQALLRAGELLPQLVAAAEVSARAHAVLPSLTAACLLAAASHRGCAHARRLCLA